MCINVIHSIPEEIFESGEPTGGKKLDQEGLRFTFLLY
jgi:hypothetical protein